MIIDRSKVRKVFEEYTSHYNAQDEKVRLKIEHTYRVSELCDKIAQSLNLSKEEIDIAWLTGMLHDVGRFEQLKNFGTFIDAQSIDHAQYGADFLFKGEAQMGDDGKEVLMSKPSENRIRDYVESDEEDTLLETAVRCHNIYRLPGNLDERSRMFCQILRDADKIDIFRANVDFPLEEIFNVSTEELQNSMVDEAVMEAFFEGHAVLHSLKKTAVDYVVGHLSLFYELVYPESRRIIIEQGYLQQMMHFQSKNPKTNEQFEIIREHMKQYF